MGQLKEHIMRHATNDRSYSDQIVKRSQVLGTSVSKGCLNGIKRLSEDDRMLLVQDFCRVELKDDVFNMAANKSAGSDGFTVEFYQKNWEVVKENLFGLLGDFKRGTLDVASLIMA